MRTRAYDWLDLATMTPWYGVECYINGKWMPLYNKEEGRPTLFETEEKRDAKRAELRKRR